MTLLLAGANARITGFSMPEIVKLGEEFQIKMDTVLITPVMEWSLYMTFWAELVEPVGGRVSHTFGNYMFSNGTFNIEFPPV
ncbi:hypothetical protein IMZ48_45665 [Candidatus Bathyarchaeota archaeon]|nr:hypothetical protein [Candidatus Bathyarchaeota archaeon]